MHRRKQIRIKCSLNSKIARNLKGQPANICEEKGTDYVSTFEKRTVILLTNRKAKSFMCYLGKELNMLLNKEV